MKLKRWQKITLIVLLIVLTIAVRLGNDHQTDFDSYWLHGMGESIQIHESALWVFHPASLLGFYPMSYPSGTPFFLATFSELTGIEMNSTVLFTSIILGLLIVGLVFILTLELFGSEPISFLSALIVSLSPTFINYTAFNAGGRVFIMPFTLLMIWLLLQWHKKGSIIYLTLSIITFFFALLAHRTAVFILPILFAFFLAKVYLHLPRFWNYFRSHRHYKKHIHPRYEKSKYYLLFDIAIVLSILVGIKLLDLIIRGRLAYNIERLVTSRVDTFVQSSNFFLFFFIGISAVVIVGILLLFLRFVLKKQPLRSLFKVFHHHYHQIFVNPQKYFLHLLLIVTIVLFFGQFFGNSFYAPSLYEYHTGVLTGSNPAIVFTNVLVNYTTAITSLFVFSLAGFIFLLYKKDKSFSEWFLIFFFMIFSGLLIDKRYTRIFLIPFIGILSAFGVMNTYTLLKSFSKKKKIFRVTHGIFAVLAILLLIVGSQFPLIRSEYTDEELSGFSEVDTFWETGQYIRTLGGDFSTLTTKELVAGVTIFASSGVPGGSHNIYYFVDEKYLQPIPFSYETIKRRVTHGERTSLVYLEDWIFGGQYYLGRHARYTFDNPFTDKTNQRIISDYHEKYYIHDESLDKNKFLESIEPVKNIVYDNPGAIVYDIEVGR